MKSVPLLVQNEECVCEMDKAFPLSFAHCKQSKTGQWEGLGTRLHTQGDIIFIAEEERVSLDTLCIDLMQLTSLPRVTKREMDSGRKSRYYAAILSGKNDLCSMERKYSGAVCELLSHQHRKRFYIYTQNA